MSKMIDAFKDGIEAYYNDKYVRRYPKYEGPLEEKLSAVEAEYYKGLTKTEITILNDAWKNSLKGK